MSVEVKNKIPAIGALVALKNDLDLHARYFANLYETVDKKMECVWDHFAFPEHTHMRKSLEEVVEKRTNMFSEADEILSSIPENAGEPLATWKTLKPLCAEQLEKYWAKISHKKPQIDVSYLEIKELAPSNGIISKGMVNKFSGKKEGISRSIKKDNFIQEGSLKHGKFHGLTREVYKTEVKMYIDKKGQVIASLFFDKDFNETKRHDPQNLFEGITAMDFKAQED